MEYPESLNSNARPRKISRLDQTTLIPIWLFDLCGHQQTLLIFDP